jgi:hypothetical protein
LPTPLDVNTHYNPMHRLNKLQDCFQEEDSLEIAIEGLFKVNKDVNNNNHIDFIHINLTTQSNYQNLKQGKHTLKRELYQDVLTIMKI